MCRTPTPFVLGIAVFLHHTSFAATDAQAKDTESRSISEERARALATYTPIPHYPYEARAKRMTGSGLVRLEVNIRTGHVTSARMLQSTGHQTLDEAALNAYRQWRFKPGTISAVRIPVTFGLQRARSWWSEGAMYGLRPNYPGEARAKGIIESGVVLMKIDPQTGSVTSASMLKSTGHEILDDAALRAFRQWRFKPRMLTTVEIPIQFTTKGVFF
jgi:TonB family protein